MMKKITLLFIALMCFTFGQSQSLPIDFESSQPFIGDSGAMVSDVDDGSGTNQVLQIVGDGSQWDNAQVTFAAPLDLSNSATNTIQFRMRSMTAGVGEVNEHLLKFELPTSGGDNEATFTTTGSGWHDIIVDMDGGSVTPTSYSKMVIMVDWGGGPTSGVTGTYQVDDISVGATPVGTDATLSDLQVDAVTIPGFDSGTTSYTYAVANGVTIVPTVSATTNDAGASAVVTPASGIPGDTTVEVTAANGTTTQTYTVSFLYPVEFPFDFEGTLHNWTPGDGAAISNGAGNDVLQIVGAGGQAWDNASVTFTTPIDLSDDANNTLRFTIQSTTAAPGEVHQHGVSFQGGGGSLEANFQTVGQDVKNVELDFNSGLGSRERLHIFTDVGDLGGIAASPNENGTDTSGLSGTYIIDNITLGATVLSADDFKLSSFKTYPNPTQDSWVVKSKSQKISSIQVYDILGKQVLSLTPDTSEAIINGSGLKAGLYFAKIKSDNSLQSIKLVKK